MEALLASVGSVPLVPRLFREDSSCSKAVRKWQRLPGRNKYCCDGRIIMSRHTGVFYFTLVMIVGSMTLFLVADGRYLWRELSPAVPLVSVAICVFSLAQLLKTAFSDPGVVPRATKHEAEYLERQINAETASNGSTPQYRPPPRVREVLINGQPVKLKYCFTCKIFRPPRTSHCSVCDNCILNFDHHCPWIGNCVGVRNYRHFYLFLVSLSILCIYVFVFSVARLALDASRSGGFVPAVQNSPPTVIVILVCFFSVWSVLGLSGFHTYLIAAAVTTNEDIKGTFNRKRSPGAVNPYCRGGVFSNCLTTLCAPEPPSLIDRRGLFIPEPSVMVPAALLLAPCAAPLTSRGINLAGAGAIPNASASAIGIGGSTSSIDYNSVAEGELTTSGGNGHNVTTASTASGQGRGQILGSAGNLRGVSNDGSASGTRTHTIELPTVQ